MNLQEQINRIQSMMGLIQESEFSPEFRRRLDWFKGFIWNNFATNYPCDFEDFSGFIRGIHNEINDVILEGEIYDEPISKWLTLEEGKLYVEKYMLNDLKEFYLSNCNEDYGN